MKPILHKIDLKGFPTAQRNRICLCRNKCGVGVSFTTYNDGFIMCWNDARRLLYDLIGTLDEEQATSWSIDDVEYIKGVYKERGMYRGFNRDIANVLGKTYTQVKSKTRRMKENGDFKKLEKREMEQK